MNDQLWWYMARAGGIVAWSLLAAGIIWGLLLSTRVLGKRPKPNWMLDLHRFLGATAVVFTAIHVVALVLDTYVEFGITDILIPFTSAYSTGAVAMGVIAMYLLVAVEVTSLMRKRLTKRTWRAIHMASYPLFVLSTAHGIAVGTDGGDGPFFVTMLIVSTLISALTLARIDQALRERRPTVLEREPADPGRVVAAARSGASMAHRPVHDGIVRSGTVGGESATSPWSKP